MVITLRISTPSPNKARTLRWAAAMQQAISSGAYAPLGELLAAPFKATVIRQLA
jgi:hypothetical protein